MNQLTRRLRSVTAAVSSAALLASSLVVALPAAVLAAPSCPITLNESGSTTVFPALQQAEAGFEAANGGCNLTLSQPGSGAGLSALLAGTVDIAASSRPLNAGTEQTNLWAWKIGGDAMVIAVRNSANMSFISNITMAQVKGIYEGTITDWQTLGAASSIPIVPRSRTTVSGSQQDLLRIFGISASLEAATITATGLARLATSADEASAACNNDYQVVYTSLANLALFGPAGSNCMKALTLGGVSASVLHVQNGTYPAPRELFLAMRKSSFASGPAADSNIVKAMDLVNYMLSSPGQAAVGAVGFVQTAVPATKPIVDFDLNSDGAVGIGDIGVLTSKWGQSQPSCPGWLRADINNDGAVGIGDIGGLTSKWGATGFVHP